MIFFIIFISLLFLILASVLYMLENALISQVAQRVDYLSVQFTRLVCEFILLFGLLYAFSLWIADDFVFLLLGVMCALLLKVFVIVPIPGILGKLYAEWTEARFTKILQLCRRVAVPFIKVYVPFLDLFAPAKKTAEDAEEKHILKIIDAAADSEILDESEHEFIHSVFDFGNAIVREVMIPRVQMHTIASSVSSLDAMKQLIQLGFSRAPVIQEGSDEVVGIVYVKDLVRAVVPGIESLKPSGGESLTHPPAGLPKGEDAQSQSVVQYARPAVFVPESMQLVKLLDMLQKNRVHMAMVVDEYGSLAGLVTLEDVLEELVGDIHDEHDSRGSAPAELSPGVFRVPSSMPIADLKDIFGVKVEYADVDSVGGILAKELGKIPEIGDITITHGLKFFAERADEDGRVTSVIVSVDPALTP